MNKVLKLSGKFSSKKNSNKPGPAELPAGKSVIFDDLMKLYNTLKESLEYWKEIQLDIPPIISAYYKSIVAKSNRMDGLLVKGDPNNSIVGIKYAKDKKTRHIITYKTSYENINKSLDIINECIKILNEKFNGVISSDQLKEFNKKKNPLNNKLVSKSLFGKVIKDAYYIDYFGIELVTEDVRDPQIVNLYNVGLSGYELKTLLKMHESITREIDEYTWLLNPSEFTKLRNTAPYLISMNVSDFSLSTFETMKKENTKLGLSIPTPTNEPIIGVIDTLFDDKAYFSSWVEYENCLPKDIPIQMEDYEHGTAISSIIVDGPTLNPILEDGCGRFKVRHFGVSTKNRTSSSTIMKKVKDIVENNRDIKVWNFSLGSEFEINDNFISPEAAILDELQYKYDIVFVVSGTNDNNESGSKKIGRPADSINSIVVNSVDLLGKPAPYYRSGPVLRFFTKPDVSAFGGNREDEINVWSCYGRAKLHGTSFAAPWITRKLAYLIYILNLPKEIAKALIFDAAFGWDNNKRYQKIIGYGVVPKHISDIIKTKDDEIKFFLYGNAVDYDTYAYNIPIPTSKGYFPFSAKATLCYTPKCTRTQGVDYTNTELDLHIGRMKDGKIYSINNNKQGENEFISLHEADARAEYDKWNNVKHIVEKIPKRKTPGKKVYNEITSKGNELKENIFWGISIKAKERLNNSIGRNLPFGLVITLKEINGKNRIQEFMALCRAHYYWQVEELDVDNSVKIFNMAEEEIEFED